jgi:hypothetical protein
MSYWYRTGTISVANGSTTVTGTLTGWNSTVRAGDMLHAGNNPAVEIASVTDNTHFELVEAWPYTTLSGANYGTELGPGWNDVTRLANDVATALASQAEILSGIGAPSDSLGSEGDRYFQDDAPNYYIKGEATWSDPIAIQGPTGATGATGPANSLAIGTVTTGTAGGSASATITGSAPSQTLNLTIPRGATGATGATGAQGPANSLTIGTVTTGDAGTSAAATITGTPPSQTLNLTIPKGDAGTNGADGADGADGSLVTATSTTSLTPALGSNVFTVASGLSFLPGMRVRGASTANLTTNWFSGIVLSYATTSLTISIGTLGPSVVSAADWNIALTGEIGPSSGGNVTGPESSTDLNLAAFNGTSGLLLQDAGVKVSDIIASAVAAATSPRNRCLNPILSIAQAGVASTSDGSYSGIDQWYVLTQTGAVASSQLTNVTDGVPNMGRLTQSQATAQRFGWAQVFENAAVKDLRSKSVTFAFKARMSASTILRYAIIEWTGTADSVTKDVVNSWTNTTFTTGQFFSGTSLTIAATGSVALTASTLTDATLSATISSSMNNIIIFAWTDSAQAQTVTLDIGNVFFGQGTSAPAVFDLPSYDDDLRRCSKFYVKITGDGTNAIPISNAGGITVSSTSFQGGIVYQVPMRAAPSISTSGSFEVRGNGFFSASAVSFSSITPTSAIVSMTISGATAGDGGIARIQAPGGGSVIFDSRL